jgi:RNA polymerase sigma-70 factor, ECF subfamily
MQSKTAPADALREEIVANLPRLRRYCRLLAGSADDGDDLCQATVERALLHGAQFKQGTRLDSWMYRIAQNLNIDQMRRNKVRGPIVDMETAFGVVGEDGVAVVEGRSELARVAKGVATLPAEQRALIGIVILDGKSYKEASEILSIPIGTVMSRIARARAALDQALNPPLRETPR